MRGEGECAYGRRRDESAPVFGARLHKASRSARLTRSGTRGRDVRSGSMNGETMDPALVDASAKARAEGRAPGQRDDSRESLRLGGLPRPREEYAETLGYRRFV